MLQYIRCPSLCAFAWLLLCSLSASAAVRINEFAALNPGPLANAPNDPRYINDEDGNSSDWIELRNPDGVVVNLNGWGLSDDPANPGKWIFPNVSIAANGVLMVYASGKNWAIPGVELHTNFKLGSTGSIVLSQPDGMGGWIPVSQILNYPPQRPRITYGYNSTGTTLGYFENPTPKNGSNSGPQVPGFVADTKFEPNRGFYDTPFTLTITSSTPGASIIYTLNGSEPTTSNGTVVPPPDSQTPPTATINITTTRIVRAIAVKSGLGSTNVDTHTYIFPSAVLQQSGPPQPSLNWSHFGTGDWEMDPAIVNNPNPQIKTAADDLKSVPTVSIVMNWNDLFGGSTAIYPPASDVPREGAERWASFEYLNPNADKANPNQRKGFQEDAILDIFGGTSINRWNSDKLSFRAKFQQNVDENIFGDDSMSVFDSLILDARYNNVWTYGSNSTQRDRMDYYGDQFAADLQRLMGGPGVPGRIVHVFLNGLYWGIYTLHCRPDKHYLAETYGGDADDWDVLKHQFGNLDNLVNSRRINPALGRSMTNETAGVNYQLLKNLASADLSQQTNFQAIAAKLDIKDFVEYMLVNFYLGNTDWSHQNWYASYNRADPNGKWRFHSWDAEHIMEGVDHNVTDDGTASDVINATGPGWIHERLRLNSEYRRIFGDIVHRHMYNGGILTYPRVWQLFHQRLLTFDEAIRAESARWGDNRREPPYTRLDWLGRHSFWQNSYFPVRSGNSNSGSNVLKQLRDRQLYPVQNAPEFRDSGNQLLTSYEVPSGFELKLTLPNPVPPGTTSTGAVFYTTDGTDPRVEFTGALASSAQQYITPLTLNNSVTIKARSRNGSSWSALMEAHFSVGTVPAAAGNLVISKIHYRPSSPTPDEIAAGFTDRDDFEFFEVLNISSDTVNIAGIQVGAGLDIAFIPGGVTELAPGERALFVANKAAFEFRYGTGLPIAGIFTLGSGLSNSGERIELLAANNSTIVDFSYSDSSPWPTGPDGDGTSLVLIRPHSSDPATPWNWRASTTPDGAPGVDDRLLYDAWRDLHFTPSDPGYPQIAEPLADPDGDGLANLLEFGMGLDPNTPDLSAAMPAVAIQSLDTGSGPEDYVVFTYRTLKATEQITWVPETSKDFVQWDTTPADIILVGNPIDHGDGFETRTYRSAQPNSAGTGRFWRLRAVMTP